MRQSGPSSSIASCAVFSVAATTAEQEQVAAERVGLAHRLHLRGQTIEAEVHVRDAERQVRAHPDTQTGGRMRVPDNVTLLPDPPYSRERNCMENVRHYRRRTPSVRGSGPATTPSSILASVPGTS